MKVFLKRAHEDTKLLGYLPRRNSGEQNCRRIVTDNVWVIVFKAVVTSAQKTETNLSFSLSMAECAGPFWTRILMISWRVRRPFNLQEMWSACKQKNDSTQCQRLQGRRKGLLSEILIWCSGTHVECKVLKSYNCQ